MKSANAAWLAAAMLALGCSSGTTPAATTPHDTSADKSVAAAEPSRALPKQRSDRPKLRAAQLAETIDGGAGITLLEQQSSQKGPQRLPVRPVAFDLSELAHFELPAPLERESAPSTLPAGGRGKLVIDKRNRSWRSRRDGDSVYIRVDAALARLQIGSVSPGHFGSERVYRTCGASYQRANDLLPARWISLDVDRQGRALLRVTDAWFDARSCKASVVRETEFQPSPVLGGLMFAYKSRCATCGASERLTIVAPALSNFASDSMGDKATASHGGFSVVDFPLLRGGAASFEGHIGNSALAHWLRALKAPRRSVKDALVGVEIAQAVSDEAPLAIAYATLVR